MPQKVCERQLIAQCIKDIHTTVHIYAHLQLIILTKLVLANSTSPLYLCHVATAQAKTRNLHDVHLNEFH